MHGRGTWALTYLEESRAKTNLSGQGLQQGVAAASLDEVQIKLSASLPSHNSRYLRLLQICTSSSRMDVRDANIRTTFVLGS